MALKLKNNQSFRVCSHSASQAFSSCEKPWKLAQNLPPVQFLAFSLSIKSSSNTERCSAVAQGNQVFLQSKFRQASISCLQSTIEFTGSEKSREMTFISYSRHMMLISRCIVASSLFSINSFSFSAGNFKSHMTIFHSVIHFSCSNFSNSSID